jgi:hypothetical protein
LDKSEFWDHVDKSGECWFWTLGKQSRGYGVFWLRHGEPVLAHRLAYELATSASVAKDVDILHTCDHPLCVRPDHLFKGTASDNMTDMYAKGRGNVEAKKANSFNAKKTHCPKGHPYSGDNLHIKSNGQRICLTCKRERERARK